MAPLKQLMAGLMIFGTFALAACSENETTSEDGTSQPFSSAPLLNPNEATEAQLAAIGSLTEADVAAIINGRPFTSMSALHAAISEGKEPRVIRGLYNEMFIKVGLNTGSEEDYKLIPSTLSPRHLAHEFEEYRPYSSIDDFAREMKKYVSTAEVENLKRYVTLD